MFVAHSLADARYGCMVGMSRNGMSVEVEHKKLGRRRGMLMPRLGSESAIEILGQTKTAASDFIILDVATSGFRVPFTAHCGHQTRIKCYSLSDRQHVSQ